MEFSEIIILSTCVIYNYFTDTFYLQLYLWKPFPILCRKYMSELRM